MVNKQNFSNQNIFLIYTMMNIHHYYFNFHHRILLLYWLFHLHIQKYIILIRDTFLILNCIFCINHFNLVFHLKQNKLHILFYFHKLNIVMNNLNIIRLINNNLNCIKNIICQYSTDLDYIVNNFSYMVNILIYLMVLLYNKILFLINN